MLLRISSSQADAIPQNTDSSFYHSVIAAEQILEVCSNAVGKRSILAQHSTNSVKTPAIYPGGHVIEDI